MRKCEVYAEAIEGALEQLVLGQLPAHYAAVSPTGPQRTSLQNHASDSKVREGSRPRVEVSGTRMLTFECLQRVEEHGV
jgi:hypothetical protein